MAEDKNVIYVVTTGEYSDFRLEYAVMTDALAQAGAEILRKRGELDVEVRPMPVLDRVPHQITAWSFVLMKDNDRRGDGFGSWRLLEPHVDLDFWDWEMPDGNAPLVEVEDSVVRVYHQDKDTGQEIAETMLQRLNSEAPDGDQG